MNTNYIDLNHNDQAIQLHQAMADHPELTGIIAKATQGTSFVDPAFADLRTRAKECGLSISAYHYLTPDDAQAQWNFFEATIGDRSDLKLIALDVEQNPTYSDWATVGVHLAAQKAANWLERAIDTGHQVALYMDEDYWKYVWPFIQSEVYGANNVIRWVAKYGGEPSVPYDLWQWADNQPVGGQPEIDCNQVNPNGSLA